MLQTECCSKFIDPCHNKALFRTGRPDFPVRPANVASLRRRLLIEHNVMLQIAKPYLSKVPLDFDRKLFISQTFFPNQDLVINVCLYIAKYFSKFPKEYDESLSFYFE